MARKGGNPDIAKAGKKTQFKDGNKVSIETGAKPYSVRSCLTYLAGQPLDLNDLDGSIKQLAKPLGGSKFCTVAQAVAVRMIERTLKRANPDATQQFIENLEGKLVQPISLEDPTVAPDENMTIEEAQKFYIQFSAK